MLLVGLTAWTDLFEHGKLPAGQRLLTLGPAGGVGGLAVQFAKAKGAYGIGTASAANLDYVRQLGAELVCDVDMVLEASPQHDNAERVNAIRCLKAGGIFVTVNLDFPFDEAVQAALAEKQATGELSANQPLQSGFGKWPG